MTVLITGAGLIGTQIAKLFYQQGETTILYDIAPQTQAIGDFADLSKLKIIRGDILDLAQLVSVFKENKVDKAVHTAALLPGGLSRNLHNGVRINLDGTLNLVEAARLLDVKRVVYTSTVGVYARDGDPQEPMDEETTLMKPGSLYGATKLMGEYIGVNYTRTYGLDFRAVRFANVFGPWSGPIMTNTGTLLKQLFEGALSGQEVYIREPPAMVMDAEWVYSKDAAQGVFLLMNAANPKSTMFNIGMGRSSKLNELVSYVMEFVQNAKIKLGDVKPMPSRPMSLRRAKEELGYTPKYDLRAAVKDMIDWYRSKPH